jgi:hypothetical protein
MKRLVLIPLLLILASGLHAQVGKLLFGFDFSKYRDIGWTEQQEYKQGFWGGLGFEWGTERLSFELDFLYIQKGSQRELDSGDTIRYTLHEISAPLVIKIKFMPGTSPYILAGGELAWAFSYRIEENGQKFKADGLAKNVDYGLVIGGGMELWFEAVALILEARYHLGLANMNEEGPFDFKTTTIAGLMGFKF